MHLDALLPVALAIVATPTGYVEAETPRGIASKFGFGQLGEQCPNQLEYACVRCGVGTGGISERLLIDTDHFVDVFQSLDPVMCPGNDLAAM